MSIPMFPVRSCLIQVRIPGSKVIVPVYGKSYYRSVFGLTGAGSSRWSVSPGPPLPGEVDHRFLDTGHRLEQVMSVGMISYRVIVH